MELWNGFASDDVPIRSCAIPDAAPVPTTLDDVSVRSWLWMEYVVDLELDDDQAALAESVRSVLATNWPATALRTLVETGVGTDELWATLVSLDWPALCVGEEHGGMGFGPMEAMLLHEGCGRAAIGGPLFPTTTLFAPMVQALGSSTQRARWLPGIAAGTCTGTVAMIEMVRGEGTPTVQARRRDDGWQLSGTVRSVIEADTVDLVVIPALADEALIMAVVPMEVMSAEPVRSVDGSRRLSTVLLDAVAVPDSDVLGEDAVPPHDAVGQRVDRVIDHAVTALAADLVGTCGAIFDLTLEHAKEREQFGVKIGSFQAIKHRLADCYLELEAARASVRVASVALAEGDDRTTIMASSALAMAADAARRISTEGIQMLGGIGFTWEHDTHLFVKRALSSSVLLGDAELHRQRVARQIGLVPV